MTLSQLFIIAATACFAVLFLIGIEAITSDDADAWLAGGLLLFAAGHITLADRRIG